MSTAKENKKGNLGRRQLVLGAAVALMPIAPRLSDAQSQRYGIEGKKAPELEVDYWIDRHGDPSQFSVIDSAGKWILLKCFQDWCPGCHSSGFPALKIFSDAFWDHPKVAIAGIQTVFEGYLSNTIEDVRKLQLQYELPITMGHDPGDSSLSRRPNTMTDYRTGGTPWLIVIDPAGTVVFNDFHINVDKLIEYIKLDVA